MMGLENGDRDGDDDDEKYFCDHHNAHPLTDCTFKARVLQPRFKSYVVEEVGLINNNTLQIYKLTTLH